MSIHLSYGQAFTVGGMFPHFLVCHTQKCKRKEFLADEFAESQLPNVEAALVNFVEVRLSVDIPVPPPAMLLRSRRFCAPSSRPSERCILCVGGVTVAHSSAQ